MMCHSLVNKQIDFTVPSVQEVYLTYVDLQTPHLLCIETPTCRHDNRFISVTINNLISCYLVSVLF